VELNRKIERLKPFPEISFTLAKHLVV
jgi:hypothetical protein